MPPPPKPSAPRGEKRPDEIGYDKTQHRAGVPPASEAEDKDAEPSYQTGSQYPLPSGGKDDVYGENDDYAALEDEELADDEGTGTQMEPLDPPQPVPERPDPPPSDGPEATRTGPPVKLEVISGPDSGNARRFNGVRMVVGRVPGCDFILADASVSRRHLELVRGDTGVLLRDLGSGNGTKVNGEVVKERVLKHGDEIAIGKTRFRFVDTLEALRLTQEEKAKKETERVAEEERKKQEAEEHEKRAAEIKVAEEKAASERRAAEEAKAKAAVEQARAREPNERLRLAILVTTVIFVLLVAVIVYLIRRPPTPGVDPRDAQAKVKLDLAASALKAERYEEAADLADQADRLSPGSDGQHIKQRAVAQRDFAARLDALRLLLDQNKLDEAEQALADLPDPPSARRVQERDSVREVFEAKKSEALQNGFDAALIARDLKQAEAILGKMSQAKQDLLRPRLLEAHQGLSGQGSPEKETPSPAAPHPGPSGGREKGHRHNVNSAEREAAIEAAVVQVSHRFHAGEYERAVLECERVAVEEGGDPEVRQRALELKREIPGFQRVFEEAQRKFKAGEMEASVRPLRKAKELYEQLRLPGPTGSILEEELATAVFEGAKAAHLRNDLSTAAVGYREALKLHPGDPRAQEGLTRLARAAEQMYMDAYVERDRDPRDAIAKLKMVLEVSAPDSSVHQRADAQLRVLQPH